MRRGGRYGWKCRLGGNRRRELDHEGMVGGSEGCRLDQVKENLGRAGAGFKGNFMSGLCIDACGVRTWL